MFKRAKCLGKRPGLCDWNGLGGWEMGDREADVLIDEVMDQLRWFWRMDGLVLKSICQRLDEMGWLVD